MLRTAGADDAGCLSWHTQQFTFIGIYSHVLVSKGNVRGVFRIYWYLSASCKFKVTHLTVDICIYPQPSVTTRNYPQL